MQRRVACGLIAGGRGGREIERLAQRDEQGGAAFERRQRMADRQMHGDRAGSDDGSGQCAAVTAENHVRDRNRAHRASCVLIVLSVECSQ